MSSATPANDAFVAFVTAHIRPNEDNDNVYSSIEYKYLLHNAERESLLRAIARQQIAAPGRDARIAESLCAAWRRGIEEIDMSLAELNNINLSESLDNSTAAVGIMNL